MPERLVGEDADLRFERGEQPLVERGVDQVADQRRIPAQSVGKGIVLQALLLQVEQESRRREPHIDQMSWGRILGECRERHSQ